jgi:hypothetical protein
MSFPWWGLDWLKESNVGCCGDGGLHTLWSQYKGTPRIQNLA